MIGDVTGILIGAKNHKQFIEQVAALNLDPDEDVPLVDATAEGWVLHTEYMVVSPLTLKRVWTKREVIDLFNNSDAAQQLGIEYPAGSLSSKRFDRIIAEIVTLILRARKM